MRNPQLIQILIVVLFVGLSFFGWVLRKLQEQREQSQELMRRQQREAERLRTGREPEQPRPARPLDRAAELAARRQQQLQELRRRAQERSAGGPRPARGAEGPVVFIPGSSGPVVLQPGGRAAPRGTVRAPARSAPPLPVPRTPAPVVRPTVRPPPPRPARPIAAPPPPKVQRRGQKPPAPKPQERRAPLAAAPQLEVDDLDKGAVMAGGPMTREQWRRAMVMREVLSQPLAMRQEEPPGALPL